MPYDIYGKYRITGKYGDKRSYYKPGHFHQGDDIAMAMDSPINAYADGEVIKVANDPNGYGKYVDIAHDNGIITRYAHSNGFNVKKGDKVTEGQIIGKVGSTGRSTGPHLHFEAIKDGKKVNPREIGQYFVVSDTIKPKGINSMANIKTSVSQEDLENIKNQIAQMQAEKELKRFELTPEEEELKKQSISSIMNRLQIPVAQPRYMTIQDLFNDKNDRIGMIPEFNPDVQRGLNSIFGTKVFADNEKGYVDLAEDRPRRIEAQMQAEKERAQEEEKMQNMLAGSTYRTMNEIDEEAAREDRFNRQMMMQQQQYLDSLKAQQAAAEERKAQQAFENELKQKQLELQEKKLEADLLANGFELNKDGTITGGASPINGDISKAKLTAADRKQLTENKTTLKNIEAGLESLEKNPNAYSLIKGLFPADITNRIDPKGVATRTQIDNITAVYRKWLTGAQMSDRERKAYERFLPAPTDNYNIVKAKLNGMKGAIERSNEALLSNYGITETITPESESVSVKKDSLGLGI